MVGRTLKPKYNSMGDLFDYFNYSKVGRTLKTPNHSSHYAILFCFLLSISVTVSTTSGNKPRRGRSWGAGKTARGVGREGEADMMACMPMTYIKWQIRCLVQQSCLLLGYTVAHPFHAVSSVALNNGGAVTIPLGTLLKHSTGSLVETRGLCKHSLRLS